MNREVVKQDILRMIKADEPLFSVILNKYDWNAVCKALHKTDKRKRKRERRESYEDD